MTRSAFRRSPALPHGFDLDAGLPYLLPAGIVAGEAAAAAVVAGHGWPIADGPLAFTALAVLTRDPQGGAFAALAPFAEVVAWSEGQGFELARHIFRLVHRIGGRRAPWGGVALDRPVIMGIVNTTPDSFSDGGEALGFDDALARALAMVEAGAAIIDVGGESTRPGADPVSPDEELRRVLPVVRALAERRIAVSIDTRHAAVMAAAVESGARIVNDVTALSGDPAALSTVAASSAAVCLMHMGGGDFRTMQADPHYDCCPLDVHDALAARIAACQAAGIPPERIAVDPGIGFGKTVDHNAQILAALALYHGLGCPLLLGASRKSFVAHMSKGEPAKARLPGTLAAELAGLDAGVQILRVHDVPETVQAMRVWGAVRAGG